jgi:DNA polymerase-3 subunit alpha
MTYQEDVMLIARELAGYSMGEADNLRRAMGKKDKEEMAKNREKFTSRAAERGIPKVVAAEIFDQAEKFAGYGFNKGHAAAYAQVAYQTAYLKANYPAEFISASMTLDIGQTERLNIFRQEAERLGIKVLTPDINRSDALFTTDKLGDGSTVIRYALAAVRNVGQQAMAHVVELRKKGGPFRSLFDFARRIDPKYVNKRALESLAAAGAFDALNPNRAQVLASVDLLLSHAGGAARERDSGQVSLFGDVGLDLTDPPLPIIEEWSITDKLQREFEAIGFYLSGHPLDGAATALKRAGVVLYSELAHDPKRDARLTNLAGTVVARQDRKSRERDTPYAFVSLSDPSGIFEAIVFSDALRQHGALLEPGQSVVLSVLAEWNSDDLKLRVQNVRSLDTVVAETGAGLRIFVSDDSPLASVATRLNKPGRGVVSLVLMLGDGREVDLELPGRFTVTPQIRNAVKAVQGVVEVEDV